MFTKQKKISAQESKPKLPAPKQKLSSADRSRIQAAIKRANEKANHTGKNEITAQDSIPFDKMWPDGVCHLANGRYSKAIQFEDINYLLCDEDMQNAIFDSWSDLLNYFDPSVEFQEFFSKLPLDEKTNPVYNPPITLNSCSDEYLSFVREQLKHRNNGFAETRCLIFSVAADSIQTARSQLERIETDLLSNFKRMNVSAVSLSGYDRLCQLYNLFHTDEKLPFRFSWDWLIPSGLDTKDFIAPSSFSFSNRKTFSMGNQFGAASFLQILTPELSDRFLAEILALPSTQLVSLHAKPLNQGDAIKMIRHKVTALNSMKIEEQQKASASGYDMDIMPSMLKEYGPEAEKLLRSLNGRNERMFLVTILITNIANNLHTLKSNVDQLAGVIRQSGCMLIRLDFQQEQGLMSSLPLGLNLIDVERQLTTSALAIFIPFTSQELFQTGNEALYCGTNPISNTPIMIDRKLLKNSNGLILGTSGSGKSFAAKREIANVFLLTNDDIIICDPEEEYLPLVERLNGQIVKISSSSRNYINPMDINANYSEGDDPISIKADFILSFCELVIGNKAGLNPVERTVIDRCVHQIYQRYFENPTPENMPILEDLYNALLTQDEKEAHHVATALEIYVKGSLNIFNHRTNVDTNNRLVCYDIKELGNQLKKIGMLIVQDQVWGRVTANRTKGKFTRYYIDEFHLLLKEEQTAAYSSMIWKRFRKWGGIPTGITQNVKDLLTSKEVENIFDNSDYICMLNQKDGDRKILQQQLDISPDQLEYVANAEEGEGLISYGSVMIPFVDHFPKNTELYRIITTKLSEVARNGAYDESQ